MSISSNINELNDMFNNNSKGYANDYSDSMNVIINDNDCSDIFFSEICNILSQEGIYFKISK